VNFRQLDLKLKRQCVEVRLNRTLHTVTKKKAVSSSGVVPSSFVAVLDSYDCVDIQLSQLAVDLLHSNV
jgi:hypothetical protein